MSINNLTNYDSLYSANYSIGVGDLYFIKDLNINVKRDTNPGDILKLNAGNNIEWVPLEQVAAATLTRATFKFQDKDIISSDYSNLTMDFVSNNLKDPSDKIELGIDNTGSSQFITIDNKGNTTNRGVFLVMINYNVTMQDNEQCYQFKVEKKVALNNDNPNDGYDTTSRLGMCTTPVLKNLGNKFYQLTYYNVNTTFVVDSYVQGLEKVFIRIRCRKQNSEMENATLLGDSSSITIVRIS